MIKKEKATQKNGFYGTITNGVLVPEVEPVAKDSIAIGCFEVTNAQYQAFDIQHTFPGPQANYPVVGLDADKVKTYLDWLNKKTGKKYRLPNEKEAKVLHSKAQKLAAKENSLNYWAGYNLTIDDVPALNKKVAQVKTTLLMNVGNFKGAKLGEATLYDLGGNAAECYLKDGKIAIYGFSAYDYADTHTADVKTKPKYVGFRVVREAR